VSRSLPLLRATRRVFLGLTLLLGFAPAPGLAQGVAEPNRAQLTVFAQAYLELAEVKERGITELARTHFEETKERVRHEIDEEVRGVLERHGLTPDDYEALTYLVSADEAYARVFREVLAEVRGGA
jgi:hypothetical protein